MNPEHDQLLDCFLEELLQGNHPPDLRHRIADRLERAIREPMLHWDGILEQASKEIGNGSTRNTTLGVDPPLVQPVSAIAPAIVVPQRTVTKSTVASQSRQLQRWAWGALAATAATAMIAALPWIAPKSNPTDIVQPLASSESSESKANVEELPMVATRETKVEPQKNFLPMDSLPFESARELTSPTIASSIKRSSLPAPMDSIEIVDIIDAQFAQLWSRSKMEPMESVDTTTWMTRAMHALVGRAPTASELESISLLKVNQDKIEWLDRVTKSDEFASHWSMRLASHWLRSKFETQASPSQRAFQSWLGRAIQEGTSLAGIQRQLLEAQGSDDPNAPVYHPATHWLIRVEGDKPSKLLDHLGLNWLDRDLACLRCHDSKSPTATREDFWGSVAMLQSIQIKKQEQDGKSWTVVSHKPVKQLYYERKDGTMAAAKPSYPDGKLWDGNESDANVQPWAQWLEQSPWRAEAEINFVWSVLWGQRLVPSFGISDEDGRVERQDLQQFLTNQLSAHQSDFRKLVVWLIASRPYRVDESHWDANQYLLASSTEIAKWQQRDRLFASFPVSAQSMDLNVPSRLNRVVRWLRMDQDHSVLDQARLAQPNMANQPKNARSGTKTIMSNEQLRMVIHSQRLPIPLSDQINAWIDAKLSWDQLVQHASWLSTGSDTNDAFRKAATEVLSQSHGDQKLALSRILLSTLGYF